ncbi:MAG TPA: GAF domain-containing sensor histidine kinase [Anaerolineae bacterium]|nr:GAF domain-containing sensor histidine kinase [Anaerolineae bacterium]
MFNWNPSKKIGPLHKHIQWLRWIVPLGILGMAALHQLVLQALSAWIPPEYQFLLAIGLYGLSGSLVVWFVLGWVATNVARQERTEAELRVAYDNLAETHRQLLAAHDIGREIASAADIQQILELAARAPTHLANAKGATVVTFDEDANRLNLDMAWGMSANYLNGLQQRIEAGIPSHRCKTCQGLETHVSSDCPLFEGLQDLARQDNIQSLVCLPLVRNEQREGIISAYFPSPNGPPEEQLHLLNIVASGIVTALDGIRLRNAQMETIYAIDHLTQTQQDLDNLLRQVLNTSLSGWEAQSGGIFLYDETTDAWKRWIQRGLGDNSSHPHLGLALDLAKDALQQKQPILIPDLSKYPIADPQSIKGLKSAAAAPLISGGESLGALVMVARRADRFLARQASFLSAIAHQAAMAISNAQLHTQVQQMVIIEERYRLSREMHDGLAQTITSMGWQLDHLGNLLEKEDYPTAKQELSNIRQLAREVYMDVREAIDGLRLAGEHSDGLAGALTEYVKDFHNRTGIQADFRLMGEKCALPPETALQLQRIVQEGLTNARKHANAQHVWVQLQRAPHRIEMTIADDGQGFDPNLPRGRHHVGLSSMRERVQSLGGSFTLATSPGQGTRITVTTPVQKNSEQ